MKKIKHHVLKEDSRSWLNLYNLTPCHPIYVTHASHHLLTYRHGSLHQTLPKTLRVFTLSQQARRSNKKYKTFLAFWPPLNFDDSGCWWGKSYWLVNDIRFRRRCVFACEGFFNGMDVLWLKKRWINVYEHSKLKFKNVSSLVHNCSSDMLCSIYFYEKYRNYIRYRLISKAWNFTIFVVFSSPEAKFIISMCFLFITGNIRETNEFGLSSVCVARSMTHGNILFSFFLLC